MKSSIKLVDEQMNWCDSAIEVRHSAAPFAPFPPPRTPQDPTGTH